MIENQILNIFHQHGLELLPDHIVFNEEKRLPVDEKDKKASFVYEIERDETDAHLYFLRIHNWKKDIHTNVGIDDRQVDATAEELIEIQRKFDAKVKERKRITTVRQETAAIEAARELETCDPTPGFPPYARDKLLKGIYGAKTKGSLLVVPMQDIDGKIWSYQTISEDRKNFKKYGRTSGCFFQIGELKDVAYFAEGFATAATIYECTDVCTIVCFSAHNMLEVTKAFRKKYPKLKIIVASDFDEVGQRSGRKAAKTTDGLFHPPPFSFLHPDYTDWNDFRKLYGEEETHMKLVELKPERGAQYISKQNWIQNWMEENKVNITYRGVVTINGNEESLPNLQREIYLAQEKTPEVKIRMELINAYTENWAVKQKQQIFENTVSPLFEPPQNPQKAEDSLMLFIEAVHGSPSAVHAAVLKHFIWQVKRKAKRLPIQHHMMLILTGKQDSGKSVAIDERLLTPLGELWTTATIDACSDDKKGNYFTDYLVVSMDEMAGLHKVDQERLKSTITEINHEYRLAYDRSATNRLNRATLIGTSNNEINEIMRDPTGIRRFWSIPTLSRCDREMINSINYLELWRSVDAFGPCPILAFETEIKLIQEDIKPFGAPELFVQEFNIKESGGARISNKTLMLAYQKFGKIYSIAPHQMSFQSLTNYLGKVFPSSRYRKELERGWELWSEELEEFIKSET